MRGNKLPMLLPLLPARIILGIILLDMTHGILGIATFTLTLFLSFLYDGSYSFKTSIASITHGDYVIALAFLYPLALYQTYILATFTPILGASSASTRSTITMTDGSNSMRSTRSVSVAYLLYEKVRVNLVDQLLVILEMK